MTKRDKNPLAKLQQRRYKDVLKWQRMKCNSIIKMKTTKSNVLSA